MKSLRLIGIALGALTACAAATAATQVAEVTVVDNVLGPEGPLYVDGNLYYVG